MILFADDAPNVWIVVISGIVSIIGAGGVVKIVQFLSQRNSSNLQFKELLRQERRTNTRTHEKLNKAEEKLDAAREAYQELLTKYLRLKAKRGQIDNDDDSIDEDEQ